MGVAMAGDRVFLAVLAGSLLLGALSTAANAEPRAEGVGVVVAVEEPTARITLDHGPIQGVMPAMRMGFRVERGELLAGVKAGDAVRFTIASRGPEWLVVAVEKLAAPAATTAPRIPAPDFTVRAFDGSDLSLSTHRGKAVLLNFWASWCIPCRTEMPAIERLYQRYKDRGFEVIAVNLDTLSLAGVEAFLKEVKVTFRIGLDQEWSTARAYRVVGLPTTYLIDRAGHVVVREIGARDWDDGASHAAVTKLLD